MNLEELLDIDKLEEMIETGFVGAQRHNEYPLTIYNYTNEAMYSARWNDITTQCRGLIVNDDGEIVARPFPKFFNFGETAQPRFVVTGKPAQIYEKMDGSLGVLFYYQGWNVATRGSFHSQQAEWATGWLKTQAMDARVQSDLMHDLNEVTHLVEIIYPENRIVVNYGDRAELVHLATLNNETGEDLLYWGERWPLSQARRYSDTEIQDITHMVHQDKYKGEEGVVMVWPQPGAPSYRLKVKRADYVEMHRIVTGMTARKVWEVAKDGVFVETLISSGVPEEWADWVREKYAELVSAKDEILERTSKRFEQLRRDIRLQDENGEIDRKKFAKVAKKWENPGFLFSMLDGKDIEGKAWDMIYPAHEVPFGGEYGAKPERQAQHNS